MKWWKGINAIVSKRYQSLKPSPIRKYTEELRRLLRPGDVILLRSQFLERLFPGYWSHTGMYLGDIEIDGQLRKGHVIQSRMQGVHTLPLRDFLSAQYAVVLRPRLRGNDIEEVVESSKSYLGRPFDMTLAFEDHSTVSCTELVYCLYKDALNLKLRRVLWRRAFLADDFLGGGFDIVWLSPEVERMGVVKRKRVSM